MKTAKFSNGHEDTYKGKRDVKAAWALINRETGGVVRSGHSMTEAAAEKTANSQYCLAVHHDLRNRFKMSQRAAEWGCTRQQAVARCKKENAEHRAKFKIEVVAL